MQYVRRGPWTSAFLVVLLTVHAWLGLSPAAGAVVGWASTNLDNLATHPLGALAASAFLVTGSVLVPGALLTLWLGIGGALWWLEAHRGPARAAGVFALGHVGATLLTVPVILAALRAGRYPDEVRGTVDVGISYGAEAVLAAVVVAVPRWWQVPWVLFVLGWPLADAEWAGALPDFTTVGHLIAATLGFAAAAALRTPRPTS